MDLWGDEFMNYALGKVNTNLMTWVGFTLDEIKPQILNKGFIEESIDAMS